MKLNRAIFPPLLTLSPFLFALALQAFRSRLALATLTDFTISVNSTFDTHISSVCHFAYVEIRRVSSIRQYLTVEATKILVCVFVLSRLESK